jgi:hypothetical protein
MKAPRVLRVLWICLTVVVLGITLYGYDDKPNSDIAVFLAWWMIGLSMPAGLLVPLIHSSLYDTFALSLPTSYISLFIDWVGFFVLGYVQWFKLLPYMIIRLMHIRELKKSGQSKGV